MTNPLLLLVRAAVVLGCALGLAARLEASPVFVPLAGLPLPPAEPAGALVSDGAGNFWGTTNEGGLYGVGTVFKINASSGVMTTVVDFANSTTGDNRGGNPQAALVSDGAGNFWGTTTESGLNGWGTIFKLNESSGAITTVVDFAGPGAGDNRGGNPQAAMVSDGAGNLWGTTRFGGASSSGTVFELHASTGVITTVVDFANSTTGDNRGGNPVAALVSDGAGNFWGTTQNGGANSMGVVFEINASTGAITTVVDFAGAAASGDNRGANPEAALVSDGAGNLWGTTAFGGLNNWGTVFEIEESSGAITTVVDFDGSDQGGDPTAELVSDGSGNFWGTTSFGGNVSGTVFEVNASSGALTTVVDFAKSTTGDNRGANPVAALVNDGAGNFWGTTQSGGAGYSGTVFEINASTGAITTVADMAAAPFGVSPSGGLVSDGAGNLWGTASEGGPDNYGTVFQVSESTGVITNVVNFANSTTGDNRGANPFSSLVSDGAGNFWGTTSGGGANSSGTVFEVNASSGAITTVVDFTNVSTTAENRGGDPRGGVVSDGAGNFWGATSSGGANGFGTVFEVNVGTGAITTVADFTSNQGAIAALASDGAGNFWGTATQGGLDGFGSVFEVNANTGAITTVVNFPDSETGPNRGGDPQAGLVSDGAGNLWGTTLFGGANSVGTVFKVNANTGAITTVVDFAVSTSQNRGALPVGAVASDGAGNFWGTTSAGGANGYGTIFEINANTGVITTVFDFTGSTGSVPGLSAIGSLSLTPAGFFGTSTMGGAGGGAGGIFFIDFGPQIAAVSSGGITASGATISGTANPEGIATSVYVQYGTTTSYGSQTSSVSLGNGTTSTPYSLALSGLTSGTTYDYQVVFVTANGNFYSANQTLTTATGIPTRVHIVGTSGWRVGHGKAKPTP